MQVWLCCAPAMLSTPAGEVAVARLRPGDAVLGADGAAMAVGQVGRLHLSAGELARRRELWPVVLGEAVLPGWPRLVLPGHRLGAAGIAAQWLVNGGAIGRPEPGAGLDIYSLELPGAPAGHGCVPAGVAGERPAEAVLRAARRELTPDGGVLIGSLDRLGRDGVSGWASDDSGHPVALELVVDGVAAAPVVADMARPDLAAAGIADGRRGFAVALALGPGHHLVRVCRARDGVDLPGSPALLEGPASLGEVLAALPRDAAGLAALRAVTRRAASR